MSVMYTVDVLAQLLATNVPNLNIVPGLVKLATTVAWHSGSGCGAARSDGVFRNAIDGWCG